MVWGQPLRSCSRSIHSALSLWLSVTLGLLARFFWSSWSWGMEDRRRRGSRGRAPSQKRMKVELDLDLKVNRSHLWSKLAKLALKISSSFHLSVWIRHFGFQSDHHLPPAKTGWKSSDDTTISFKFKYREEDVWVQWWCYFMQFIEIARLHSLVLKFPSRDRKWWRQHFARAAKTLQHWPILLVTFTH